MEISVAQGGKFTFTIKAKGLSQGLRTTKRNPRDSDFLTTCIGAVGRDGTLQVIDAFERLATDDITDGFPFPQIFVFTNIIIVCGLKKIYEWNGTSLDLKYTAADAGGVWSAVDFYDYVYMSNGKIAVIRDAGSYVYDIALTQPFASAICNYNGQVIIGAPDVPGLGASLMLSVSPITVGTSQLGTMTVT
jgi:hypothetical protein